MSPHHIRIIFKDALYPIIWMHCIIYLINILLLDADFFHFFFLINYHYNELVLHTHVHIYDHLPEVNS